MRRFLLDILGFLYWAAVCFAAVLLGSPHYTPASPKKKLTEIKEPEVKCLGLPNWARRPDEYVNGKKVYR